MINLIKKLRNATQAGFMDCKKALELTAEKIKAENQNFSENQHLDAAIKWLRENGIAKAADKNANKVAAEGITLVAKDDKGVALFELNTQTDFTAASESVVQLSEKILSAILDHQTTTLEQTLALKLDDNTTIKDACLALSATTGEKIELRRLIYYPLKDQQSVGYYVHNNKKIAAFIIFDQNADPEQLKGMAMHLAAMDPKFLDQKQVDQTWLNNERDILMTQLSKEDKPKEFQERIINGRIQKLLAEVCLVSQSYILNDTLTVGEFAKSLNVKPIFMARFKVGDGIEKNEVDFASEVAAQMRS
ncbi:translation elongation factor Ts [[Mycoplasma] cavipharyngis]|uniref:translation elongation factor Ts n=1 Tax=[Mycoplasma] cavipharyngis TaxID=92757 RepID=UPI00370420E6